MAFVVALTFFNTYSMEDDWVEVCSGSVNARVAELDRQRQIDELRMRQTISDRAEQARLQGLSQYDGTDILIQPKYAIDALTVKNESVLAEQAIAAIRLARRGEPENTFAASASRYKKAPPHYNMLIKPGRKTRISEVDKKKIKEARMRPIID